MIESVRTGVALRHLARRRIEDGHAVETGLGAETAAYAFLRVDHDETVGVALMVRLRGTDLHAGGIGAVVARDRDVVDLHVLVPGARGAILTSTVRLHFNHFAEVAPHLKIVGVLARDDAGLATRALRQVDVKTQLLHFLSSLTPRSSARPCALPQGSSAADCSSRADSDGVP